MMRKHYLLFIYQHCLIAIRYEGDKIFIVETIKVGEGIHMKEAILKYAFLANTEAW